MTQLLTAEEERKLITAAQNGDMKARGELILRNRGLCCQAADRSIRPHWMDRDDLISEAVLGLAKAIDTFDLSRGCRLSSYAYHVIRGVVRRCVERTFHDLHTPKYIYSQIGQLRKTKRDLTGKLGRKPTNEELAAAAGVPVQHIEELSCIQSRVISLDDPVYTDESLAETLVDNRRFEAEVENAVWIEQCLQNLPPDLQEILVLRYGLNGQSPLTLEEIGKLKGCRKCKIHRQEKKALRMVRETIAEKTPP